ncbi:Hepar_II_III_N domain-containing protein [Frankia sp. Hr75.2]|nr:Hepar_II_III_N domain-containing protein [Frankia sp. Hr75.2]
MTLLDREPAVPGCVPAPAGPRPEGIAPGSGGTGVTAPVGRYLRTVRHLRAGQVVARVRLRGRRAVLTRIPIVVTPAREEVGGGWPAAFVPFDGRIPPPESGVTEAGVTEIRHGRLSLLGHSRVLFPAEAGPEAADWEQADAPLLWRYHLHYWDWAWNLARAGDPSWGSEMFTRLYRSWRATDRPGRGVSWSPYVVSLRAWTLCALGPRLAYGTPVGDTIRHDLGLHRSFLRANRETDVGGNHLLKNLKALLGLAVAARDRADGRRWLDRLMVEIDRQILTDGGHYERAPAYHCQVLADLDDVIGLLSAADIPVPAGLPAATASMRAWLATVMGPDGALPLLNDGYPPGPGVLDELLRGSTPAGDEVPEPRSQRTRSPESAGPPVAREETRPAAAAAARSAARSILLADTGLVTMTAGPWHVLADVGVACPDDLPAHAHADTLSFLLWHGDVAVLVDTGTSTYDRGPTRDAERGSAAHSTVTVDDTDSSETWGAFRVGRRARPRLSEVACTSAGVDMTASHDGFRHLPGRPTHTRRWTLTQSGLRVDDKVTGAGVHHVRVFLHFPPGFEVSRPSVGGSPGILDVRMPTVPARTLRVRAAGDGTWSLVTRHRATGWQTASPATTAIYLVTSTLPVHVRTEITAEPPDAIRTAQSGDRPETPGENDA